MRSTLKCCAADLIILKLRPVTFSKIDEDELKLSDEVTHTSPRMRNKPWKQPLTGTPRVTHVYVCASLC
jgi:hypothetical protein